MKKIFKIVLISSLLLGTCAKTFSQNQGDNYNRKFKLGIGVSTGLPFNDPYNFNLGGDLRLQYNLSETYSLTFTTGFNNLFVKDDNTDLSYIPIKIGYKSFIFKNEFYVMGEVGVAFSVTKEYDTNSLLFSPSVGYATKYVDISVRYEFLKDFPVIKDNAVDDGLGQVMLRLAYGFDL
ncbi:hypothetical protein FIA58_014590 [Flavobacterium jejuense]|uniref:Outer membrane protein beta-barrel domain-containing protein n=1 Tax=Flavobacterium jejuense TaxID=1544455 RepID=A0ABX0IYW7_9FLAO|nr:hypothetical protein [Flavobacterium jejuense]NHN26910.1 hypothetical protein [Flavobacterium jejuense]